MNTTAPSFSGQLEQFGEAQLADVSTHDINTSTAQLLLTTVFFTGAAISMAKQLNTPKKTYLATLRTFFEDRFGLSNDRASGMIESNARLYKRFVLIEKTYHAGWNAAQAWGQQTDGKNNELKELLKKYHNLSMSELNIEGTKEQIAAHPEVEATPSAEPETEKVMPPNRWWLKVLLTVLFALICGLLYVLFFTDLFPELLANQRAALIPLLNSILEQLPVQSQKN